MCARLSLSFWRVCFANKTGLSFSDESILESSTLQALCSGDFASLLISMQSDVTLSCGCCSKWTALSLSRSLYIALYWLLPVPVCCGAVMTELSDDCWSIAAYLALLSLLLIFIVIQISPLQLSVDPMWWFDKRLSNNAAGIWTRLNPICMYNVFS